MKKLLIVSACICRKDIHNIVFTKLFEYIRDVPEVHLIANIDPCSGKNKETQDETKRNLTNLCKKYNISSDIRISNSPCFFSATKYLFTKAGEILDDKTALLWFEDDKLINKYPNIKEKLEQENDFIVQYWMISDYRPCFYPCLWSCNMARQYLFPGIVNQDTSYDPELLLFKYFKANFKNEVQIERRTRGFTTDIGRRWQNENGITKWTREKMENVQVTYI